MPLKVFLIPVRDIENSERELNSFIGSQRVLSLERNWVEDGVNSFWSICVDYLPPASEGSTFKATSSNRARTDYREILSPEQFALFAKLRDFRKEIAQQEAVPVYTVFTNEQLAQMVQRCVTSKVALREIDGIGEARIDKYADRILLILSQLVQAPPPL